MSTAIRRGLVLAALLLALPGLAHAAELAVRVTAACCPWCPFGH